MRKIKWIALYVFTIVFTVSCLNNNDDGIEVVEGGWIAFFNVSPGSNQLRLYADGDAVPGQAVNYGEFNTYSRLDVGEYGISVRSSSSEDMTSSPLEVGVNKYYGAYAVNTTENIELIFYLDNHTVPTHFGKTLFRFMQLSPNMPEVKLKFETEDEDFGTYNFKESTGFQEIESFENKYVYLIDEASNDTLLSKQISLLGRTSYVLFSKGIMDTENENQQLDFQLIEF